MKTIALKEIVGSDLLSRKSARYVASITDANDTLNFDGISFMSRTFADEICSLLEKFPNVTLTNMNPAVKTLLEIVKESRNKPRKTTSSNAKVMTFEDMESLCSFLTNLR